MLPAIRPSRRASVLGFIAPQSATTVQVTGWLDATVFHSLMAIVQTGAITATGLVDATFQQATSSGGAGAKQVYLNNNGVNAKSIVQFTAAGNSSNQAVIDLHQEDLDIANGFKWVQLSITPSVAAALIAGQVMGFDPRQLGADATINKNASQVQIV